MGVCGGWGVDYFLLAGSSCVLYVNGMVQTPVSHLAASFK